MKILRGNYPGASEFAFFDASLNTMSPEEMRCLLTHILHQASPGHTHAAAVFEALSWAESNASEYSPPKVHPCESVSIRG